MILFISNNESINFENNEIKKVKLKAEAIKINVKNFKSKAKAIIVDEEYISSNPELFDYLKGNLQNQLIIYKTSDNDIDYPYIININKEENIDQQLENLISKLENPDIENEEKTSKNKKFRDNNKIISQEIKDMISQLSSPETKNQDSDEKESADDTDELSFNNILEKENKNDKLSDDVEEKSEVVKTQDDIHIQEEKKENIHTKDDIDINDLLEEKPEEESKANSYELAKSELLRGFDDITKANKGNNSNNFTSKNNSGDNKNIESKKLANLEKIARRKAEEKEKKKKQQEKNNIVVTKTQENKSPKEDIDLETIDAVKHDVDIQKKKESELKNLIDGFEDAAHVKKEKIDEYLNKQYSPTSQNDNIYMSVNSVQKEKKFDFNFKIPKLGGIKNKKDEDTLSPNISVPYNQNFIINTNGEIAVVGGLRGVGTTYCCFKIANSYPNVKVGYVQYIEDEIEISILKEAKEKGYINDNINIYSASEKLSAYQNSDIVIVDYGYFDKFNNPLMLDFERTSNKYFVVNYSFNKFTSINNAISYSAYNPNFITIFNMYDETQLINLQKEFKDLNIQIFGFRNLI